ncbi:F-box/kelch-repeat protein At3g23880-like [Trifolium pratense]|uniref:F-box/kelch-repeat protein At3g23880-like n=1 Tax=Trifolium pratense TaxID=57577 RepID=UPI001E693F39|nr:F-box/kelch-repeat protein At3g23880-like [Trifolium pratense]
MGSTGTIASLPSLPMELVEEEILCRLPVKILLQLRCVCKSWRSLISDDPKFTKKHLCMSKILKQQQHLILNVPIGSRLSLDCPLSDFFSDISNPTVTQTQLNIPISNSWNHPLSQICSCDGLLCLTFDGRSRTFGERPAVLCNPSLRKYSTLPPLENHRKREYSYREVKSCLFSFGYDHVNDVYKVIAISCFKDKHKVKEVDVYTLGTNNWRSIQDFPYSSPFKHGVFVGGTVNWLVDPYSSPFIVSLDLKTESYQKISQPDLKMDLWALGMFRDCLCIFANSTMFLDVWIMKEYGIKESWTKLYNVPYVENQYTSPKTLYISDDDQMLFGFYDLVNLKSKLAVYNSKNGNVKIPNIQYIDSLI